jgi:predicted O-methyltransferase YrrM
MEEVARRSDASGNCEPAYDFVYLDGAKSLTIDGVSVLFIERLLRPGGWLLLDDLDWSFGSNPKVAQTEGVHYALSPAEREEPHVRAVFELIVKTLPSMTNLRLEDGRWGWAQKAPGAPKRYQVAYSRPLGDVVLDRLRRLKRSSS